MLGSLMAVGLVAVAGRLLYGRAEVDYDAAYALVWGRDIVHGYLGALHAPIAPTPHPLTNLIGLVLSGAGVSGSIAGLQVIGWLSFGALGVAAYWLGMAIGGRATGVVSALLILTRPQIVGEALITSPDILFLALVVAAAAYAAAGRGHPSTVLWILLPAGLLRPDAWLLAGAWAIACTWESTWSERVRMLAIAALAPMLWALADLILTGNPLFSLSGTRTLAETLARPRSASSAAHVAGAAIHDILGPAVFAAGIAGVLLQLWRPSRARHIVVAVLGLGVVAFVLVGLSGLPVLVRYTLLPASMLAVLAAWTLTGFRDARSPVASGPSWTRPAWLLLAVVLAAAIVADVPATRHGIRSWQSLATTRNDAFDAFRRLVDRAAFRSDLERCGDPIVVPNYRPVPLAALWLGRHVPVGVQAPSNPPPRRVSRSSPSPRQRPRPRFSTAPAGYRPRSRRPPAGPAAELIESGPGTAPAERLNS